MTAAPPPHVPDAVASTDGVVVAVHDLGGTADSTREPAPRVLLISHATGFHGRCYDAVARGVAARLHPVAFDYRGHGATARPDGPVDWERYGDDALAVARALPGPLVGFGHSMGGACLLMAAHRDPTLFRHLVLFEPIVFPPSGIRPDGEESPLAAGARRRRASFPSHDAALEHFRRRPPLSSFTDEALEGYVRHGFAPGPDGQVHLRCRPETEAETFETGGRHATWDLLPDIATPTLVVAGRVEPTQPSQVAAEVAGRLPHGAYLEREDLDHFGPMTHPAEIAALILGRDRELGDGGRG